VPEQAVSEECWSVFCCCAPEYLYVFEFLSKSSCYNCFKGWIVV